MKFKELIESTNYVPKVDKDYVWEKGGCEEPNCLCNTLRERVEKMNKIYYVLYRQNGVYKIDEIEAKNRDSAELIYRNKRCGVVIKAFSGEKIKEFQENGKYYFLGKYHRVPEEAWETVENFMF